MIYILIAIFVLSLANLLDEFSKKRYVRKPIINLISLGLFSLVFIPFFLLGGIDFRAEVIILGITAGFLFGISMMLYYFALWSEKMEKFISLSYFSILFIFLFATLTLKELLKPERYIGLFLLIFGAFFLSFTRRKDKSYYQAAAYMLLSSLFTASYLIIIKYLTYSFTIYEIMPFFLFGNFIISEVVGFFELEEFVWHIEKFGKNLLKLLFMSSSLYILGLASLFYFIEHSPLVIAAALMMLQAVLSYWHSKRMHKEMNLKEIVKFSFSFSSILIGLLLLIW